MTSQAAAVFDLDGTITKRDTLLPFLRCLSTVRTAIGLLTATPWIARSLRDRNARDEAKQRLLSSRVSGLTVADADEAAGHFADRLVGNGFNPEVVDRISRHQAAGHRLVIASASPEFIVDQIAERLGFHDVVATRLAIIDGRYTGRYDGSNVRSREKLRRVVELLGRSPDDAYGNLPDDEPMLRAATRGFVVKRGRITSIDHRSA